MPPESDSSNASNRLKPQLRDRFAALALKLGLFALSASFAFLVLRGGGGFCVFGSGSGSSACRNFGRHVARFIKAAEEKPNFNAGASRLVVGNRAHAVAEAATRCRSRNDAGEPLA